MGSYEDYTYEMQKNIEAVMPWVGMYIAAASAVCTLAMAADAINGFRNKKFWFPCKYFSLSSTWLTLLAVAMKLSVDLTTVMVSDVDWFAKISSLIFMSTAMGNFISSLGSMNVKEILTNVIALGIMNITIVVNVWIQLIRWKYLTDIGMGNYLFMFTTRGWGMALVATALILVSVTIVSSAISVPTAKRKLELRYQEMHKIASREEEGVKREFRIEILRREMMKYWVMAETGSPQFVIARSAVPIISTAISMFSGIIFIIVLLMVCRERKWRLGYDSVLDSEYGMSTIWILVIQSIGVIIGTIKLILRWLVVVSFDNKNLKKKFKIETHWIQTLVDWRDNLSTSQIQNYECRKYLHDVKWLVLNLCISLQIFIVFVSKLFVFLTTLVWRPFLICCTRIKKFKMQHLSKEHELDDGIQSQCGDESELNLNRYILLLEGEAELPKRTLKNICQQADKVIQTGKRNQPKNLINLLHKVVNFSGVREFDSNQVPSSHSQEPPNCWTLPVVTLTCIAIALPGISKHKAKQLVSGVGEGLALAKIIEETMKSEQLVNIRNAADFAWVEVALYRKWQDMNLQRTSHKFKNCQQILQEFSNKAGRIVSKFKAEVNDLVMENPLNWPGRVIAANSMHRISQTIMLSCKGENEQAEEGLFEQLSVMIADILAACLTNLPRVITTMCHHNTIEKREKNIHKSFHLLGQTEEIVELLQQLEWPSLDPDKAVCIEEWRALLLEQHYENQSVSSPTSRNEISSGTPPVSNNEESLAITVSVDLSPCYPLFLFELSA